MENALDVTELTLNAAKCEFRKPSMKFLDLMISNKGINVDLLKTDAIRKFSPPNDIRALQRFMGSVNHIGKFIPQLSLVNETLWELLKNNRE